MRRPRLWRYRDGLYCRTTLALPRYDTVIYCEYAQYGRTAVAVRGRYYTIRAAYTDAKEDTTISLPRSPPPFTYPFYHLAACTPH